MSELSVLAEPLPDTTRAPVTQMPKAVARRRRRQLQVQVLRVALALVLVGFWELATRVGVVDPFFWGKPSGIAKQIWIWVTEGTSQGPLWEQIATTMEETVLGFLIGVVLGVVFGILLGRNRFLADIMSPYIKAANAIPRVVMGSIFVLAFGLGMQSKVALAVVLVFFIVFFNAFQGVREVDKNLLANARILGADDRRMTTEVIIPSALSWIMASLHVSFGFALVGAVVGEYLGAIKGVGLMIVVAQNTFNANGVFAAIVILATVALVAEAVVTAIENRLVKWRPNAVNEVTI
jgi:NitT/TauT family transport system permease protein